MWFCFFSSSVSRGLSSPLALASAPAVLFGDDDMIKKQVKWYDTFRAKACVKESESRRWDGQEVKLAQASRRLGYPLVGDHMRSASERIAAPWSAPQRRR